MLKRRDESDSAIRCSIVRTSAIGWSASMARIACGELAAGQERNLHRAEVASAHEAELLVRRRVAWTDQPPLDEEAAVSAAPAERHGVDRRHRLHAGRHAHAREQLVEKRFAFL